MVLQCHGCSLVCKTTTGLSRHIKKCADATRVTVRALEDREAAKIARRHQADVAQERQVLIDVPQFEVSIF